MSPFTFGPDTANRTNGWHFHLQFTQTDLAWCQSRATGRKLARRLLALGYLGRHGSSFGTPFIPCTGGARAFNYAVFKPIFLWRTRRLRTFRLQITHVRQEVPAPSARQPTEPVVPAVSSVTPAVENKIISRHWHNRNAFSSTTKSKQTRQTASNKKSKTVDRKGN